MKKWIAALLVVCLTATVPMTVKAYVADDYYYSGPFCYYIYNDEAYIQSGASAVGDVEIPSTLRGCPVVGIDMYAFCNAYSLTGVVIPDTVRTIGNYAFKNCRQLTSVSLPNSLTQMGLDVFSASNNLKLTVYNNCAYLGNTENPYLVLYTVKTYQAKYYEVHPDTKLIASKAFDSCCNMSSVTIPGSVFFIGDYAFQGCMNLKTVYYGGYQSRWQNIIDNIDDTYLTQASVVYTGPLEAPDYGEVDTWNLVLKEDIGVNFEMEFTNTILADKNAYVEIDVAGEITKIPVSSASNGMQIDVAPAQMMDEIKICIVSGSGTRDEVSTYSVRGYADAILSGDYSNKTKNMVRYMLIYGAMAQKYFGCNESTLANEGVNCTLAAVPTIAETAIGVNGEMDGIAFYGASLRYDNKIALRYYFTGDVTGCTFTANGAELTPVEKDGRYFVEIPQILPQDLDNEFSVTVQDASGKTMVVTYSPLNYIVRMYNKADATEETKNLLQALYTYHLATEIYTA